MIYIYLSEDVELIIGYLNFDFKGNVEVGDRNLIMIGVQLVFNVGDWKKLLESERRVIRI